MFISEKKKLIFENDLYKRRLERVKEELKNQKEITKRLNHLDNVVEFLEKTFTINESINNMNHIYLFSLKQIKEYQYEIITLKEVADDKEYKIIDVQFDMYISHSHLCNNREARIRATMNNESKRIYIGEIESYSINQGNGTKIMEALIVFAKLKGVKKITAEIVPTDAKTHFDRLVHFYRKFGFNIGDIRKDGSRLIELYIGKEAKYV